MVRGLQKASHERDLDGPDGGGERERGAACSVVAAGQVLRAASDVNALVIPGGGDSCADLKCVAHVQSSLLPETLHLVRQGCLPGVPWNKAIFFFSL